LSRHKFQVTFNEPSEDTNIEFKLNLGGQNTTLLIKDGEAFRDSLGATYAPKLKENEEYFDAFAELHVKMK